MNQKSFIELNRTFYQLPSADTYGNDLGTNESLRLGMGGDINWGNLLEEYRVILLSEAGSGKTEEIRQATSKLRSKGKPAFFIRLEHISNGLESSFEEGSFEEFQAWLNSNDKGWLLLDSIDEARLKNSGDFEKAVKTLSQQIFPALQRVHIIITGRVGAWRPKTDLSLCKDQLPFKPLSEKEKTETNNEEEFSLEDKILGGKEKQFYTKSKKENVGFKVYSLADLSPDQVGIFLREKGINNTSEFLDEIRRHDAWAYTTRPQDLEEIIEFWDKNKRLGTHLELMQHNVERRLNERDQDRADSEPISAEKVLDGARRIAAAVTLMHESTIRVPDGSNTTQGINAKSILSDWNDKDCSTLLGRPIFDEAIYGSVRFHHRSVREFLTAKWLSEILKKEGSRRNVEHLFFRQQYGSDVITPSMRPILPWLVLFDEKIRQKVFQSAPEIFFEGGDPSRLPLETRRKILRSVCDKISSYSFSQLITNSAGVQRFAKPDMANDVQALIAEYRGNPEITFFLLRMVWQGRIKLVLPEAKTFALNNQTEKHTHIAAIRAVREVGSEKDYNEILQFFLSEEGQLDRGLLSELIDGLETSEGSIKWIFEVLEKTENKKSYSVDNLDPVLVNFVQRLDLDMVAHFLQCAVKLLDEKPLVEQRFCQLSKRFGWLMNCSVKAIERLILSRHSTALDLDSLSILTKIPAFQQYEYISLGSEISELVREWDELNYCLFWKGVEEARKVLCQKGEVRLINFWQVGIFGECPSSDKIDFEVIKSNISERDLLDDRLVALSLAFQIYKNNGRPRNWREQLKKLVAEEEELKERLDQLLHPPVQSSAEKKGKQKEAYWKRQDKERKKKDQESHEKSLKWLEENFEELRSSDLSEKAIISNAQYYLLEHMRKQEGDINHWTAGNWHNLVEVYGKKVVDAFRVGLLNYWRNYKPCLLSEEEEGQNNQVPGSVVFGLTGLAIEFREINNWHTNFSERDAELACRYAFWELNGFPNWFPKLHEKFPDVVNSYILKEIDWELKTEDSKEGKHYIIHKVSWNCKWLWNSIAKELLRKLQKEPINLQNLIDILKIVQGSSLLAEDLATLASEKCNALKDSDHIVYWFVVWVGVAPAPATNALSNYLSEIEEREDAKNLVMDVINNLLGLNVREAFKTPEHLKKLYLLMHKYIRVEEDINRADTGVYSPTMRDNAQNARETLFSILKDIPGEESFLVLKELSEIHPVESFRFRIMRHAIERAETDADILPWSAASFCEFSKSLEFTPTNHRELFDLAVQRLLDLKYDLEDGDNSLASILINEKREPKIRNFIGGWCREKAQGKYSIQQEEELADAKKPDLRFLSSAFDAPVPVELKLADNNWGAPKLFELLQDQLCGDYLRDNRSNRGIFLLVYRGEQKSWQIPNGNQKANFFELLEALQKHWEEISNNYPKIEQIEVIGIDLTKRSRA